MSLYALLVLTMKCIDGNSTEKRAGMKFVNIYVL